MSNDGWYRCNDQKIKLYSYDTLVLGSGAAGLSAAERLDHYGIRNQAIVTESLSSGTSRNAGSDKQTYYKLSLLGKENESVYAMAKALFDGGSVDGDVAFTEAANSLPCFFRLCELGVDFPMDTYGEFVGYKTDHDSCSRGTSIGPYTSRRMFDVLLERVQEKNIPIFEGYQFIQLLCSKEKVYGILCLNLNNSEGDKKFSIFLCNQLIIATGGPAGIYAQSVFPSSQHGSTGILLAAGLRGKNLTEWQFGMSSLNPRWNVSGSYMQVLPRFYSTLQDGKSDEQEFLEQDFSCKNELLNQIFLKGYQWPFDVNKIKGSSRIDLLVYRETVLRNRRVFLDYRVNPHGRKIQFDQLSPEVHDYLKSVEVEFGTPVQRLRKMNEPAYQFYLGNSIDLEKEPLEIAVCVQHNNGGIDVDHWWQTNIHGIFACGEVACTHGVYRPGGSALNAGQVGAERAAFYISHAIDNHSLPLLETVARFKNEIEKIVNLSTNILSDKEQNVFEVISSIRTMMSAVAGIVRDKTKMEILLNKDCQLIDSFQKEIRVYDKNLSLAFTLLDILYTQRDYLKAYIDFAEVTQASRGSSLYQLHEGNTALPCLGDGFLTTIEDSIPMSDSVQVIERGMISWRKVRQIPSIELPFEKIWKQYRDKEYLH